MDMDNSVVKRAREGDRDALVELVMQKNDEYYKLAYSCTWDREEALDALQDMIVILYDNIRKLKNCDAFYSWSKTILVNCCRSNARKRKKVVMLDDSAEEHYIEKYENSEQRQDILRYLGKLNKHQQEAIQLRYFMDMDYEAIASMVKAPLGTVKSRISEGLGKLRELLGGDY